MADTNKKNQDDFRRNASKKHDASANGNESEASSQKNADQNDHGVESEQAPESSPDHPAGRSTDQAQQSSQGTDKGAGNSQTEGPSGQEELQPEQSAENEPKLPLFVGVGASAGGLEPLFAFVEQLKPDSLCAYFIIQHQSLETGESLLSSLLSRRTSCETLLAEDGMPVEAGHIYVTPPGKLMSVDSMRIRIESKPPRAMAIDHLLRSLAEEGGDHSAAVILSGSDTDGTLGARAIMEKSGLVITQNPTEAAYETMPRSIVDEGFADLVLKASEAPGELADYAAALTKRNTAEGSTPLPKKPRDKLLDVLKNKVGHDFSIYKENTINRRIQRRMDFHKLERVSDYLQYVRSHEKESFELFKDMLISVTSFFRDPQCFASLKRYLAEEYLPKRKSEEGLRAWVPGCATGEEAYSLGIVLAEAMSEAEVSCPVTIYATDLDTEAIAMARHGTFPQNIEADIEPKRLNRFFTKVEDRYRIKTDIRDMIVFAEQNVLRDPPFSNVDIVLCRNLLMYFKPTAQRHVIYQFAYALNKGGLLMLGPSEGVGENEDFLTSIDTPCRLYVCNVEHAKRPLRMGKKPDYDFGSRSARENEPPRRSAQDKKESATRMMERILLNVVTPPSVIVNKHGDILYIHGRTGELLEPMQGMPDANVLRMAREGLRMTLATMLSECAVSREEKSRRSVTVQTNAEKHDFDIMVRPVDSKQFDTPVFTITFQRSTLVAEMTSEVVDGKELSDMARKRIAVLESEINECRESMRSIIEDYEVANEELRSSNEELESTNEELKSTNEELETAKEELQSINEEQTTLNAELQTKNEELQRISNDMDNLLVSTDIATMFLDQDLTIKRFTPSINEIMSLRDADIGRPVSDISMKLDYTSLISDAEKVLDDLTPVSRELKGDDNTWYQMRIRPYKTMDKRIDGVVVTFNDITQIKHSEQTAKSAQLLAESVIETVSEPLLVLEEGLDVTTANHAFLAVFGVSERNTVGENLADIAGGRLDIPKLKEALTSLVKEKKKLRELAVDAEIEPSRPVRLLINARYVPFSTGAGEEEKILMSIVRIDPAE